MASKELLKRIDERNYLTEREHREFLERLSKDLEILEIIKEQLHINVYIGYFNYKPMYFLKIMACDIFITKEIYDKIKEWLENEN